MVERRSDPDPGSGRLQGDEGEGRRTVSAQAALSAHLTMTDLVARFAVAADAPPAGGTASGAAPVGRDVTAIGWPQALAAWPERSGRLLEPLPASIPPPDAGATRGSAGPVAHPPPADRDRALGPSSDLWAEAGRHVIGVHFGRMRARIPGTIEATDLEELHAMRVAARRLRAAWRVFRMASSRRRWSATAPSWRNVGNVLGLARDLDVQLSLLAAHASGRSPREAARLEPLARAWQAERDALQIEVRDLLGAASFAHLCFELEEFARTDGFLCRVDGPPSPPSAPASGPRSGRPTRPSSRSMATSPTRTRNGSTVSGSSSSGCATRSSSCASRSSPRRRSCCGASSSSRTGWAMSTTSAPPPTTRRRSSVLGISPRASGSRSSGSDATCTGAGDAARQSLPRSWSAVRGPRFRAELGRALVAVDSDR